MQVYNATRLQEFQANLCEVFSDDKKQHYCGNLLLGWAICKRLFSNISKQDFNQNL